MAMIASELAGIPWSCTARADIRREQPASTEDRSGNFRAIHIRERLTDGCIARAPLLDGKTAVIHVGVAIPDEAPCPTPAEDSRVLLCPANLYPVKGHEHLIRAMAILRDRGVECVLQIAGKGGIRPELERLVSDLRLGGIVQFLGQLSHDDILLSYGRRRIGMVILPSVDLGNNLHEGIPVCLMEAMAYRIPVVSTTTVGFPSCCTTVPACWFRPRNRRPWPTPSSGFFATPP